MTKLTPELIEVFNRLMHIPINDVVILEDGISNVNYLINHQYVMKVKTKDLDPFNHIPTDVYIQSLMADQSLSADVIAYDKEARVIISTYLSNTKYLPPNPNEKDLGMVANVIQILHQMPTDGVRSFDPVNRYRTYQELANTPPLFPKLEEELLKEFTLYFQTAPQVLSHNDVVQGNLLFKDDHLYLIDYEYAGLNDPLFDHLSFLTENNIDNQQTIDRYFHEILKDQFHFEQAFLIRYITFIDLLWYYWALAYHQKTKKAIFLEIAEIKKNRLITRLT